MEAYPSTPKRQFSKEATKSAKFIIKNIQPFVAFVIFVV